MKGFDAIQEYTNGFITAPSKDDVEIKYEKGHEPPEGAISFEITDGEAFEVDYVNSNNEIYKSGAGAGPGDDTDTLSELVSSVQGGDNEAPNIVSIMMGTGKISDYDRTWGRFNYQLREPGSSFVLNGQYGHLYEIRLKQSQ